ncbi:MAG TPA: hypothetical protein PK812_06455 [Beijerinckiaceae bacterium]|nr:hypothetical protein [Beijerinckiaceae bacterium]
MTLPFKSAGARFLALFLLVAGGLAATLFLILALLDPYGVSPLRLPISRPMMDINQRYMYPQVARSGRFDSAVFGTSTLRLLDPEKLDAKFGGAFANLAMNAATPWEQLQLASLMSRHTPGLRTVILGLDAPWCEADADALAKRTTFRAFPESFYDDSTVNDLVHFFNLKTLEITGRLLGYHLGRATPRIRQDGYENFLPPETDWTPAYAERLLWTGVNKPIVPVVPPYVLSPEEARTLRFPAIDWLGAFASALPAATRLILIFPPNHIAGQPIPGSRNDARERTCREALLRKVGKRASIIDMKFANDLTRTDSNYWDSLHFRLPIADEVLAMIHEAISTDAPGGAYWRRLRP